LRNHFHFGRANILRCDSVGNFHRGRRLDRGSGRDFLHHWSCRDFFHRWSGRCLFHRWCGWCFFHH
jgi:hypothetical protein